MNLAIAKFIDDQEVEFENFNLNLNLLKGNSGRLKRRLEEATTFWRAGDRLEPDSHLCHRRLHHHGLRQHLRHLGGQQLQKGFDEHSDLKVFAEIWFPTLSGAVQRFRPGRRCWDNCKVASRDAGTGETGEDWSQSTSWLCLTIFLVEGGSWEAGVPRSTSCSSRKGSLLDREPITLIEITYNANQHIYKRIVYGLKNGNFQK